MKTASAVSTKPQDVQIIRDKMGVAHVYADTMAGLFYGGAYASAQDRLAEGETAMRLANGRMAEIRGAGSVEADKQARQSRLPDNEAESQFNALSKEHQEIFRAMHAGWNDYVKEVRKDPKKLPYEFKEWGIEPTEFSMWEFFNGSIVGLRRYAEAGGTDGLNLSFYRWLEATYGQSEAKLIFDDVLPLRDPDAIPTVPPAEDRLLAAASPTLFNLQAGMPAKIQANLAAPEIRTMSRAFIIGKSHTATGSPIALQATADGPTIHLSGAGINTAGWYLPPFGPLLMGRSYTHAFQMTAPVTDVIDIFVEKINPDNSRQYWFNGAWRDMEIRRHVIQVKNAAPVEFEQEVTVHGPVTSRPDARSAYAMKSALRGAEFTGWAAQIDSNRATDFASYKAATYRNPVNFNHFYTGEDGTLAYFHIGRVPIRADGLDPRLPTPGTGEYEWKGFVPPEDMPQIINPKQDYLFNWNTKASLNWPDGDGPRFGATHRAWMPPELIAAKPTGITIADVRDYHRRLGSTGTDFGMTSPKFFAPYLQAAVANDAALRPVVDAMVSWNAMYEDKDNDGFYDNPGLAAFRKWVEIAKTTIIDDDLGDQSAFLINAKIDLLLRAIEGPDAGVPMKHDWMNGRTRDEVLRETVAKTAAAMTARYGSSDVKAWKHPVFYRYYDCSITAQYPDHPPYRPSRCGGGTKGLGVANLETAGRLGLQPKFVPDNMSEAWSGLMDLSPQSKVLRDVTPSGGQNQFISTDGKGNPNIADQVDLHLNFDFKTVELDKDKVMAGAVSQSTVRYSPVAHR